MIYCTNCGCPLEEDANFCITCGAKVIHHSPGVRSLETTILEAPGAYVHRAKKEIPLARPDIRSAEIALVADAVVILAIFVYALF